MATSNDDLAKEIESIDSGFATSGKNKKELTAMLAAAKSGVKPDDYNPSGHVVAKGKSITSLKGILSEDAKVNKDCFKNGSTDFDRLVKNGVIVKG